MVDKINQVGNFLKQLGVGDIEAKIFLALVSQSNLTALELSRLLRFPRTSLYRKLEEMKNTGLVEEVIDEYKTKVRAASLDKLGQMVSQKEREFTQIKSAFNQAKTSFANLRDLGEKLTEVRYFRGQEAVARMSWQALKTKDLFRGYTHRQFAELIGFKNALAFKEEWRRRNRQGREIFSDAYLAHRKENPSLDTGRWPNWETRYLPASVLNINHQFDIYEDIVAIYNWHEGEVFGVLIRSQKVADLQKQIFDLVWKQAKVLRV